VGNSLGFLLTLNLGAILGYFLGGRFADRGGVRRTTIGSFAGAAIFLAVFALPLPEPILYGALFLAGFFVSSSQALRYAHQRVYPNHLGATGSDGQPAWAVWAQSAGLCSGAAVLTAGIAYPRGSMSSHSLVSSGQRRHGSCPGRPRNSTGFGRPSSGKGLPKRQQEGP